MSRLTLRDVIEALCHYNVRHLEFPLNAVVEQQVTGITNDREKTVYLEKDRTLYVKRKTIIHELTHCKHNLLGDLDSLPVRSIEKIIEREEKQTWKSLYGRPKRNDV